MWNNRFKRGYQHPSNKFEILWQVDQNSFSILLSYFVAQYVLIIVVQCFLKIYFSFWEMIFFVRPLKCANFHPECYLSCVTSCNEFNWHPVFLSAQSFVLSSKINPRSLLKLAKKYLFFGEYFCPTFSMSKSSIKTKTVLTVTDMTEPNELLAFKRQKDGYNNNNNKSLLSTLNNKRV